MADKAFKFADWLEDQKARGDVFSLTKGNIRNNINDAGKLRNSPPEALGQLLQTIVEVPEEEDFESILKVLESASRSHDEAHKLKWIIRAFIDPGLSRRKEIDDVMRGRILDAGIGKLMRFGEEFDSYDTYSRRLNKLLNENKIIIPL